MLTMKTAGAEAIRRLRNLIWVLTLERVSRDGKEIDGWYWTTPQESSAVSEAVKLLAEIGAHARPCTVRRDGGECRCHVCRGKAEARAREPWPDESDSEHDL